MRMKSFASLSSREHFILLQPTSFRFYPAHGDGNCRYLPPHAGMLPSTLGESEMRYIGKKQVCYMLGISRATLDRWSKNDPDFPRVHKRDGKRNAQCKWLLRDIETYMSR
jgi:predicted DNA-binding transcriptional regulator AlpA